MRFMSRQRFCVVAIVLGCTGAAFAAEKPAQAPPMSADEKAMQEKWMAFMTPGPEHQVLAGRVGKWDAKVTIWQAAGAPPISDMATTEVAAIFDGRYFADTTAGHFMGMPFNGHGLMGYDNMKKKYFSAWIDNMGTGLMVSEGTYDAATKTFSFVGQAPDVMAGTYRPTKSTEKWVSADEWQIQMFNQTPDGKGWWKNMEIVYTRAK
jgi:hypothetical protein